MLRKYMTAVMTSDVERRGEAEEMREVPNSPIADPAPQPAFGTADPLN